MTPKEEAELLRLLIEEDADNCRGSYKHFLEGAWGTIEPGTEYKSNWHIDAICDHLEAVANGSLRRLLICIPPRHMKSITTSVAFLPWNWASKPHIKMLSLSYAKEISIRDSVAGRRLINSNWYQERFGGEFVMTSDQDTKSRWQNDKNGFRIATSTEAALTGDGGHIIVCLPGDEVVYTSNGKEKIRDVVERSDDTLVWSRNMSTGADELVPISGRHTNPGKEVVKVELDDGTSIRCTPDHLIWTASRGWVPAGGLTSLDVLEGSPVLDALDRSCADAVFLGEVLGAAPRVADVVGVCVRDARALPVLTGVLPGVLPRDILPELSVLDPADHNSRHPELLREFLRGPTRVLDLVCSFIRELGEVCSSMLTRVPVIVFAGSIPEVTCGVVDLVPVRMKDERTLRTRPDKRGCHRVMGKRGMSLPISAKATTEIPVSSHSELDRFGLENGGNPHPQNDPSQRSYVTPVGDFVVRETRNRRPVRIVHDSFPSVTYCISTQNHNFFAGECKALIHNCDDPINSRDSQSPVALDNVIDVWTNSLSTRLNDPKTGCYLVIMQRLHHRDLAGYILEKELGWDTLILPARYEKTMLHPLKSSIGFKDPRTKEGELLWPERFGEAEISRLEKQLGSYGAAGQLQQRPSPAGGGIIKTELFKLWPATDRLPRFTYVIQSYDTAYTEKTSNDPTAMSAWGIFEIPGRARYGVMLLDYWTEHLTYPDLRERMYRDYCSVAIKCYP